MSPLDLAMGLHAPASRINDIVLERCGITPDTVQGLAYYFGGDADPPPGQQLE